MSTTSQVTTFSDTDLAWAAGIIDGEGCIHIQRNGRAPERWLLHVSVCNTDPRMTHRMLLIFGGNVCDVTLTNKAYRPQTKWEICGSKAAEMLRHVRRFLVAKGEQADVAMRSREFVRFGGNNTVNAEEKLVAMRGCAMTLRELKRG